MDPVESDGAPSEMVSDAENSQAGSKVWASLITNTNYLPGLLALAHSLQRQASKYPLLALYTDSFPEEGRQALDVRGIARRRVAYLLPSVHKEFHVDDARFYETWTKLTLFSLTEYGRVVLLDSDMVVVKNMDELMHLELDHPGLAGQGDRVVAACHACVCNPTKKTHYPEKWIPANCAYTAQHSSPEEAQVQGAPSTAGLSSCNSGLLVVNPSRDVYNLILHRIDEPSLVMKYDFPDQDLLSDLFRGRWVGLPYVYNALKTLRRDGVHDAIWRDDRVKCVHYIMTPKPWDEEDVDVENGDNVENGRGSNGHVDGMGSTDSSHADGTGSVNNGHADGERTAITTNGYTNSATSHGTKATSNPSRQDRDPLTAWWWEINRERLRLEAERGICDGY